MYPNQKSTSIKHLKQQGIGLPATIFLIVILSLIVVAMSDLTESSNLGFGQDLHSMRAFYAAESGAQIALNRVFVGEETCININGDLDFNAVNANAGLTNCTATLSCSDTEVLGITYFTFKSEATCGTGFEQAQRSVEVRAHSE
jgi:MSHA biogenesis protein MshP